MSWSALAVLLALAAGARASDDVTWPFAARIVFSAPVPGSCGRGAELDPAEGIPADCTALAEGQLEAAFSDLSRRMFRAPTASAREDLTITVSLERSGFDGVHMGARVFVAGTISVADSGGAVLGTLPLDGDADVLDATAESVVHAFARAATAAARDFERRFEVTPGVRTWLERRQSPPVDALLARPPRTGPVAFVDASVGVSRGGGDGSAVPGYLGRIGVSNEYFVVQALAGHTSPTFGYSTWADHSASPPTSPADLSVTDLGLEAGPIWRPTSSSELRVGGGAHLLWGAASSASESTTYSFSKWVPSAFVAFQIALFPTRGGNRVRLGVEARRYFGTVNGFPEWSRKVPAIDDYLGLYLGFEFAWSRAPARPAGAAR